MELQINTDLDLGDVYWIFYAGKIRNIVINDFSIYVNRKETGFEGFKDWFDWVLTKFKKNGEAPKTQFKLEYTYYGRVNDFQGNSYHRTMIHKDDKKSHYYVTDNSDYHRILYKTKEELLSNL